MLAKLIFLFVTVPLVDMILLMILSSYIGWMTSVAMVILSGILGAWLASLSYKYVIYRFTNNVRQLQFSSDLLTDSAMIFFAAGLLLTPGFLTDLFGFSLLIPACRNWYKPMLARWLKRNFKFQFYSSGSSPFPQDSGTVDGEVDRSDTDAKPDGRTQIERLSD